jgi:hypothetical protein
MKLQIKELSLEIWDRHWWHLFLLVMFLVGIRLGS